VEFNELAKINRRKCKHLFGILVRNKREAYGFPVSELARRLQKTEADIRRLESGQHRITQEFFEKVNESLSIEQAELHDIFEVVKVEYLLEFAKGLTFHA